MRCACGVAGAGGAAKRVARASRGEATPVAPGRGLKPTDRRRQAGGGGGGRLPTLAARKRPYALGPVGWPRRRSRCPWVTTLRYKVLKRRAAARANDEEVQITATHPEVSVHPRPDRQPLPFSSQQPVSHRSSHRSRQGIFGLGGNRRRSARRITRPRLSSVLLPRGAR